MPGRGDIAKLHALSVLKELWQGAACFWRPNGQRDAYRFTLGFVNQERQEARQ